MSHYSLTYSVLWRKHQKSNGEEIHKKRLETLAFHCFPGKRKPKLSEWHCTVSLHTFIGNQTAMCRYTLWFYIRVKYMELYINILICTHCRGCERSGAWLKEKT